LKSEEYPPVNPGGDAIGPALRALVSEIRPVVGALKRSGPPPAIFREAFHNGALGPRHAPVLLTVALEGQLSVSEIAERLGLSLSTISLLVGELDRAGLLARSEDPSDRRRTLVGLADGYREAAESWLQERIAPLRRTLERLPPRQCEGFLAGVRILREEMTRRIVDRDC
jgi:DNA-binding MarR family transcriptional regulator